MRALVHYSCSPLSNSHCHSNRLLPVEMCVGALWELITQLTSPGTMATALGTMATAWGDNGYCPGDNGYCLGGQWLLPTSQWQQHKYIPEHTQESLVGCVLWLSYFLRKLLMICHPLLQICQSLLLADISLPLPACVQSPFTSSMLLVFAPSGRLIQFPAAE